MIDMKAVSFKNQRKKGFTMNDKCGCGRPVRYSTSGDKDDGSCNKYKRCPSYEELRQALEIANRRLDCYQNTVNKIDDYFEYRMESKQDQKKIFQLLGNLTDSLKDTN